MWMHYLLASGCISKSNALQSQTHNQAETFSYTSRRKRFHSATELAKTIPWTLACALENRSFPLQHSKYMVIHRTALWMFHLSQTVLSSPNDVIMPKQCNTNSLLSTYYVFNNSFWLFEDLSSDITWCRHGTDADITYNGHCIIWLTRP